MTIYENRPPKCREHVMMAAGGNVREMCNLLKRVYKEILGDSKRTVHPRDRYRGVVLGYVMKYRVCPSSSIFSVDFMRHELFSPDKILPSCLVITSQSPRSSTSHCTSVTDSLLIRMTGQGGHEGGPPGGPPGGPSIGGPPGGPPWSFFKSFSNF